MAAETGQRPVNPRVDTLLQAGADAFSTGDKTRAHEYWREAATLDPYDERVWISLLRVLESPNDRRVCLENIVSINPLNSKARRQLRVIQERMAAQAKDGRRRKAKGRRTFKSAFVSGILIGLLAVALGIFMSVVLYGIGPF